MGDGTKPRRTRVERGIYRQPNGNFAVCARRAGRLHFRTVAADLEAARRAREDLVAALEAGRVPASPRLRFDTVAGWWRERFEAMVKVGDRHARTLAAHCFHLDHHLLPRLGSRRVASIGVEDVADLITELRTAGSSAKTTANALATLQSVLRFARRRGWILADPVELLEPEERPHPPRHSRGRVLGQAEIERLLDACPSRGRILVETALFIPPQWPIDHPFRVRNADPEVGAVSPRQLLVGGIQTPDSQADAGLQLADFAAHVIHSVVEPKTRRPSQSGRSCAS